MATSKKKAAEKAPERERLTEVHEYPVLETQSDTGKLWKVACNACGFVETQFETPQAAAGAGTKHENTAH